MRGIGDKTMRGRLHHRFTKRVKRAIERSLSITEEWRAFPLLLRVASQEDPDEGYSKCEMCGGRTR
jgi:hypothetical protein